MTKAKLNEAFLKWNKEIGELDKQEHVVWEKMKDMSEKFGDGKRWCSEIALMESVSGTQYFVLMVGYVKELSRIEGQKEALRRFLLLTNNFDIGRKEM